MEATGTAVNLSGLAPKGTAEPAVMVATGEKRPVAFTGSEVFWACAGGTAECATPFELRSWEFSGSFFACEE